MLGLGGHRPARHLLAGRWLQSEVLLLDIGQGGGPANQAPPIDVGVAFVRQVRGALRRG